MAAVHGAELPLEFLGSCLRRPFQKSDNCPRINPEGCKPVVGD